MSVGHGYDAFTVKGFDNWKKVNDGKNCAFLKHIGCSQHRNAVAFAKNLMNQEAHIENIIVKQNEAQYCRIVYDQKASIDTVRWLTFHACALRGNDESYNSKNRGNILQLLKLLLSYNDEVANVILEKDPYNSKYTYGEIQIEILSIIANKFRKHIRSKVGDSLSHPQTRRRKVRSWILDLKMVKWSEVVQNPEPNGEFRSQIVNSGVQPIVLKLFSSFGVEFQGQSSSSGVKARVPKSSLRSQLIQIHFLSEAERASGVSSSGSTGRLERDCPGHAKFGSTIVLGRDCSALEVVRSAKLSAARHDELQKEKATKIEHLLELGEIESKKVLNQVGTLRRAGDTRWGSHFRSISSLLSMFDYTRVVLQGIIEDVSATYSHRGDADAAYCYLKSFESVFILHLIKELMGKTDILSQALQKKSQDILNAMELVSAKTEGLNDFRNNGCDSLLAQKYYTEDFTEQERIQLRYQLEIFNIDMKKNPKLSGVSTIADLCKGSYGNSET
uniref:DUF4371 domain-containing protein n=1 Tax=Lactuca sativa TaxID=4236 RepID=A0A9R1VV41_LACSA|nr:hypothetical protein LSAT_V11C400193260 [Lactuca sativa]